MTLLPPLRIQTRAQAHTNTHTHTGPLHWTLPLQQQSREMLSDRGAEWSESVAPTEASDFTHARRTLNRQAEGEGAPQSW